MAHADLIDSLIGTYRGLNLTIRPIANEQAATAGASGKSLLSVLADLRAQELATSQQLKNMTMAAGQTGEVAIPEPFNDQDVRVLLSEFGTAREAILALVRNMSDEQLDMERTARDGTTTIRAVVQGLAERDQQVLAEINSFIPAARV
ncbi:MAG TPA: hypothetical protein VMM78_06030 [Thermomicrobiales bacterium]|nr:hypothetical protein [Thermomicrobiales bacterium]